MQNSEKLILSGTDTLLFDLDATLGPYVQKELSALYFSRLTEFAGKVCDNAEKFGIAAGAAFEAMKKNDGSTLNTQAFHRVFESLYPDFPFNADEFYDRYYKSEDFRSIGGIITHFRGTEKDMLHGLRQKGYRLVCATNPVFPMSANEERMRWAGLEPSDFDYITLHSNSHWCKPSEGYFAEVATVMDRKPSRCIMIGNDTLDDLEADKIGMQVILITDFLKDRGNRELSGVCTCTYNEFLDFADSLDKVN